MLPNSFQKKEKGIALITSLLFLLILSLSWISFSFFTSDEEGVIQNQIDSDQAAYLAEAGIQQALWFLSQDWNWQNWTDNKWGNGGTRVTDGSLIYYQWSGNLGDTAQAYTVQIRNDGQIQSKIVATGNIGSSNRTITVELGSAFDYGLYSHKFMEFRTSNFTVSGANQNGYVYSKDSITGLNFLSADKITGNFALTGGPANFSYFPKEIPLPELGTPKFEAKINGTPTSTLVRYNNDNGEDFLEKGALLHNKTRGNFRKISPTVDPNKANNTITTEASTDNWAAGDKIVLERIEVYENQWNTLNQQLNNLNSAIYGDPSPEGQVSTYNPITMCSRTFSDVKFTGTPPIQFYGNITFSGNIKIEGNAVFGRRHDFSDPDLGSCTGGGTTISGNMVINGNAYFFNRIEINGRLYVTGSVVIQDHANTSYYSDAYIYVYENASHVDGIVIQTNGGLFVRDGTLYLKKNESSGGFQINDYCYVYGDITIESNYAPPTPVVNLPTDLSTNRVIYVRNGSLTVGSPSYPQDLSGWGKIIVGHNVSISRDLLANDNTKPMAITVMKNLEIRNKIGTSSATPFFGLIYSGGILSRPIGVSPMTYVKGAIIGGDYSNFFNGGSVIYYANMKQDMPDLGFTNNRDFVRPLLWSVVAN